MRHTCRPRKRTPRKTKIIQKTTIARAARKRTSAQLLVLTSRTAAHRKPASGLRAEQLPSKVFCVCMYVGRGQGETTIDPLHSANMGILCKLPESSENAFCANANVTSDTNTIHLCARSSCSHDYMAKRKWLVDTKISHTKKQFRASSTERDLLRMCIHAIQKDKHWTCIWFLPDFLEDD